MPTLPAEAILPATPTMPMPHCQKELTYSISAKKVT
jgi:hypothetical protein